MKHKLKQSLPLWENASREREEWKIVQEWRIRERERERASVSWESLREIFVGYRAERTERAWEKFVTERAEKVFGLRFFFFFLTLKYLVIFLI